MLFEPYTRSGMLQRLDAEMGIVCGPPANVPSVWIRNRVGVPSILAVGGWMLLLSVSLATAQSTGAAAAAASTQSSKTSTQKPPAHHAVHHHHRAKPEPATVAAAPAAPPPPVAPADQPAKPATIDFKNGELSVRAQNSSLVSVLSQIQHQTGLVVDGLTHDQRIYGQYGPGSLSTTLSALLDGSGYDFVIVGAGSTHASPRLILSTPGAPGAAATPPPAAPAVVSNEAEPAPDATENPPPETSEGDAPQAESDQSDGDQAGPADPTTPPQAKSPQEIFDELRSMHPQ
jgi:hypothetical protein